MVQCRVFLKMFHGCYGQESTRDVCANCGGVRGVERKVSDNVEECLVRCSIVKAQGRICRQ